MLKNLLFYTVLSFSVIFIFQCKPKNNEQAKSDETKKEAKDLSNCKFLYDPSTTKLQWTAFKFTEKTGVGGTFSEYKVEGMEVKKSITEAVQNMTFSIDGSKVFTNVRERDQKIAESFFGTMEGGISGYFKNITGTDSGTADMLLTMNGIEKQVPVEFSIKDQTNLSLKASINVNDWKAEKSLKALNKVCDEQHKGKDGESKLWPDVDILITTTFQTQCD